MALDHFAFYPTQNRCAKIQKIPKIVSLNNDSQTPKDVQVCGGVHIVLYSVIKKVCEAAEGRRVSVR